MRSNTSSIDEQMKLLFLVTEAEIAMWRARQVMALDILDRAGVVERDGATTLVNWLVMRSGMSKTTAQELVEALRGTRTRRDVRTALSKGQVTFDQAVATARAEIVKRGVGEADRLLAS